MKSVLRIKHRNPSPKRAESGTFDENVLPVISNDPDILLLHFPTV